MGFYVFLRKCLMFQKEGDEQMMYLFEIILVVFSVWLGFFLNKKLSQKKVEVVEIDSKFCYQTKDGVLIEKNDINNLGKELDTICIKETLLVRNIGKVDLEKNDLTGPLKIRCDNRYIIKKVNVYGETEGINFETHFDDFSIDIIWNLLKKGDVFKITIIAEVEDIKNKAHQTKKKQVLNSTDFFKKAKISIYGKNLKGNIVSIYDYEKRNNKQIALKCVLLFLPLMCIFLADEFKLTANSKSLPLLYDVEIINGNPKVIKGMELFNDLGDFYFIKDTITLKYSVKDIEKDVLVKNVYFNKAKQEQYARQQSVFRIIAWGLAILGMIGFAGLIIVGLAIRKNN